MAKIDWDQIIGKEGRAELLRFQLQMITRRTAMGWTHKDLKNAIKAQGFGFNPEAGSIMYKMVDVQEWCKLLGGKLVLTFPGVPVPDTDELDLIMGNLAAVFNAEELDRWKAVRYLGAARLKAGIGSREFGDKIGLSSGGVTGWEQNTDSPMIPALIRHAQVMGGTVRLDFEEVEQTKGPRGR